MRLKYLGSSFVWLQTLAFCSVLESVKFEGSEIQDRQGLEETSGVHVPEFEGLRDCPTGGTDEELNECIRLVFEDIRPFLAGGLPELDIPPLDPYRVARIEIPLRNSSSWRALTYVWTNVEVRGFSGYTGKLTHNTTAKTFTHDALYPNLRISAEYTRNGHVLGIPLEERKGRIIVTMVDFSCKTTFQLQQSGDEFRVVDADVETGLGGLTVHLPDLARSGSLGIWVDKLLNHNALWIYERYVESYLRQHIRKFLVERSKFVSAFVYFYSPFFLTKNKEKHVAVEATHRRT